MSVQKDESGRRYVQAEVEVPGTPEEVWQAIATGPGVTSWFVPTEIDGRPGGDITANFGPGMVSHSTVRTWDPPRRFTAENEGGMGPGSPAMGTEWIVEARSGGTCVVRVVHSWFAETDDWDNQFAGTVHGWGAFFRILNLYLTYFRGQTGTTLQMAENTATPVAEAWPALLGALGIDGAGVGDRVSTADGVPALAGVIERVGAPEWPELLIRLDQPTSGVAHLFAMPMGGKTHLRVHLFLYGDQAAAVAGREEPLWQSWLAGHAAPVGEASDVA